MFKKIKKSVVFVICLFLPPISLKAVLLRALSIKVSTGSRIGHIIMLAEDFSLDDGASISSFNFVGPKVTLSLMSNSSIGFFNIFMGDFECRLNSQSCISNFSNFRNAGEKVIPKKSLFILEERSKITSSHYFDLSCSILIGKNCVIGGRGSQIWTHGFIHEKGGLKRYISLRGVEIHDGVYVGASVIVNPGTIIEEGANVLSGSVLAGLVGANQIVATSRQRVIVDLSETAVEEMYEVDPDYKCGNPRLLGKYESSSG